MIESVDVFSVDVLCCVPQQVQLMGEWADSNCAGIGSTDSVFTVCSGLFI